MQRRHNLTLKILIALTTLPFFALVEKPYRWTLSADNAPALALYLAAAIGYVGISLLVWQLVLGTRSMARLFFEDLPSKLRLHKNLGKYGIAFVFLHPLLMRFAKDEDLLYAFTLDFSSASDTAISFGRFAFFGLLIVWLTAVFVRAKIGFRPWKLIHYLAYPTLFFALLHAPTAGNTLDLIALQIFWILAVIVSLAAVLLRIRMLLGYGKTSYTVADNKNVTDEVTMLRLKYNKTIQVARAGQYVYLQRSRLGEEHPFTILDYDENMGEITVAFKRFGSFTKQLSELKKGDRLWVDGPYGVFTKNHVENPDRSAVFIAGGIGITPFVRHVLRGNPEKQFMIYGNQTRQNAAFRDILKQRLGDHFVDIYSKEKLEKAEDNVEYGYLSRELITKYLPNPQEHDYYICGPKPMMTSAKTILHQLGVPKQQIHTEEFGF